LHELPKKTNEAFVVAEKSGAVGGAVTGETLADMGDANPTAAIGDIAQRNYVVVLPDDSVWKVVAAMRSTGSEFALVGSHDRDLAASSVQGIIRAEKRRLPSRLETGTVQFQTSETFPLGGLSSSI
jgi:predicted transcriptional regulator